MQVDCAALVSSINCADPANSNVCKQKCTAEQGCFYTADNKCKKAGELTSSEATLQYYANQYTATSSIIPQCALQGTCNNVNDVLQLLVNYGNLLFGIVGSLALVMFVIGGFTIILSMGNPERFKKGFGIIVYAVVGLMIIFGADIIVNFMLEALGVSNDFKGI